MAITAPLTVGSTSLTNIRGLTMSVSVDAEDLDIIATGGFKAYVSGRKDVTIGGTLLAAVDGAANAADVAAIATAFASGEAVSLSFVDSVIGTVGGKFICTKMDANYAAGKIISYNVEFKPTYDGTTTFSIT